MVEIREISDDDYVDFSKMRYGTVEYLFLTHVWYYASMPTLRRYFSYDKNGTDLDVILRYQTYIERVRQGYYGFTEYDEEKVRLSREKVFTRG